MTEKEPTIIVKFGTCVFCMNEDLALSWRGDELMCDECRNHFDEEEAMNKHDFEESLKYEGEDWVPEDGFDEDED